MRSAALGVLLLIVLVAAVFTARTYTTGAVSRRRLDRFAQYQRLQVTVDNGNQVIRYLATTRRWRAAGFIGGIVASQVGAPPNAIVHFNFIAIFTGWFLGALVAEVRVAHLEYGSIRTASLQPRRPRQYVRRFAWALVPAVAVVALATGVATAGADVLGWAQPDWPRAGAWLAVALIVAVTVRSIQHAVLRRAQPIAAPDVIEADDAIRSRSLHVLAGGGAAVVLFMVLNQLDAVHPVSAGAEQAIEGIQLLGWFAVALLGWLVSTSIWPPPGATLNRRTPAIGTT